MFQIYEFFWLSYKKDGSPKTTMSCGNSFQEACRDAGIMNGALPALDYFKNPISKNLGQIAAELEITVEEVIFYFRGLFGKPKLGEGFYMAVDAEAPAETWLLEKYEAEEFIRLVKQHHKPWEKMKGIKLFIDRGELLKRMNDSCFRLPTADDLKPGTKMYMLDIGPDFNPISIPIRCGTRITLDQDTVVNGKVHYRCEGWDGQCFVPVENFVKPIIEREHCGPSLATLYAIEK